ncbi:MAG: AAA family ATPase [Thermodesulfobacteriota bacterium]
MPVDAAREVGAAEPGPGRPRPDLLRGPLPAVPLIGRSRELADLRASLEATLADGGRIVLLGGEPGIGKTRLARTLADQAEARGVPVWWGRGFEDGSAPAFWPWSTALRRWIDRAGREAVTAAAGPWSTELAHVFPALCERSPDAAASESTVSDGARFRLFDLVGRFLAEVARPAGLVVVLDDVHWADLPSLKLLEFIAADLIDTRILIVLTYRDTEVERSDPFLDTLSRLARKPATRRLHLAGLSPEHCARWIASTGASGDVTALGEALHRETNGNPFFVGEIVQLLGGDARRGAGREAQRVPHGVREVIARRLERLGDGCRATLALAALLGDAFDARTLGEVLGTAPPAEQLERAVRDRILLEQEGRRGCYSFAHALIRRVLVDELSATERSSWHARIASVLESRAGASAVATTELVRHLTAAGTPEALRKAVEHACRAGEHAARSLGWEEAVRLYEIALDVAARSGLLGAARAAEIELALARALRAVGDVPAARARCENVMTSSRRTGDQHAFARAALVYAGPIPEWGRVEPAVRAVLEEACRAGTALDDALRARLCARLAGDLIAANELAQGARVFALCDEAAAAARRADAAGPLAIALITSSYADAMGMRQGAAVVAVPSSLEILEAAEAAGEHEYAAAIRHARAMRLLAMGKPEHFSAEVDALATEAASSRVPEALWLADALQALRACLQGRFAEAHEAIERAAVTGRRAQLPNTDAVYATQRIMWHALQGRLEEVAPEIESFVDAHPGGAAWRPFRALARLARGDAVAARAELQDLLARGLAAGERGVMARAYLAGLAALCVALRDREHAPLLYECVARRPFPWSVDGCQTVGPWALLLGGLARLCGRPDDAAEHFETAIRLGRRAGSPPIVARAQSLLASLRLSLPGAADERGRIAEMLAEAAQCARDLGLRDVAARVSRLEARLEAKRVEPTANAFRCEGDVWHVRFGDRELRIRDGKGPRYLAALLAAPGRDFHVLELAGGAPPAATATATAAPEGLTIGSAGAALEDAPDAHARREYRARLEELREELEDAEQRCDIGRADRIRTELDFLVSQLAQSFAGRSRTRGPAETARKAVTKVVRTHIGKLLDAHAALGEHLRECVRMGTFCAYAPRTAVQWEVAFPVR